MNSGQVIRKAAKLIEKHGWIQGRLGSRTNGGYCIAGAVIAVVSTFDTSYSVEVKVRETALIEFTEWLRGLEIKNLLLSIPSWNDHPTRTKEEVLLYMNKFADEMDPQ